MTLTETLTAIPPPIALRDGILFVTGTRVPIDTIIYAYLRGDSPAEIADSFDTVGIENVFAVLSYYHRHKGEVEDYLERGRRESEELHRRMTPILPSRDMRDRLNARTSPSE